MKKIDFKKHDKLEFRVGELLNTKDCIRMVLDNPPDRGFTNTDIQKRNRIEKQMNETKDGMPIILEDADHEELTNLAKSMGWPRRDNFFHEFVEDLKNAKSYTPPTEEELANKRTELHNGVAEKEKADG
jgi:hypothetical protein